MADGLKGRIRIGMVATDGCKSKEYSGVEKTLVHNGNLFMWQFLFQYCTSRRF